MNLESVWDYPRPPRLEPAGARIRILYAGQILADTMLSPEPALRILETSHPPVYYLPPSAIDMRLLHRSPTHQTF